VGSLCEEKLIEMLTKIQSDISADQDLQLLLDWMFRSRRPASVVDDTGKMLREVKVASEPGALLQPATWRPHGNNWHRETLQPRRNSRSGMHAKPSKAKIGVRGWRQHVLKVE
jgi:hypothetical protein